jgi:hypothetical protein
MNFQLKLVELLSSTGLNSHTQELSFGNNKYIDEFIIDRITLYHQLILFGFLPFFTYFLDVKI